MPRYFQQTVNAFDLKSAKIKLFNLGEAKDKEKIKEGKKLITQLKKSFDELAVTLEIDEAGDPYITNVELILLPDKL